MLHMLHNSPYLELKQQKYGTERQKKKREKLQGVAVSETRIMPGHPTPYKFTAS